MGPGQSQVPMWHWLVVMDLQLVPWVYILKAVRYLLLLFSCLQRCLHLVRLPVIFPTQYSFYKSIMPYNVAEIFHRFFLVSYNSSIFIPSLYRTTTLLLPYDSFVSMTYNVFLCVSKFWKHSIFLTASSHTNIILVLNKHFTILISTYNLFF